MEEGRRAPGSKGEEVKKIIAVAALGMAGFGLIACGTTDADVVSENLSKEADQFNLERRIVFFNGITDKYLMTIEGKCSINPVDGRLDVTCKTPTGYKKHFLGLSDNVSYFAEQLDSANVSADHYKVIFKPEVIVPDIDRK
jgi:hypothetical protein